MQFKRSRLERNLEDEITKKTVVVGGLTVVLLICLLVFGLPLLVKLSVLLGEIKGKDSEVVEEKVLPPLPPRLIFAFEATNSSLIKINGYAEKGVKVELLKNDVAVSKVDVGNSGDFEFAGLTLDEGENIFTAVATSLTGGSSQISNPLIVKYDNKPPDLVMTNPSELSLKVESPDFDVVGKTEKGVSVMVNGRVALVDNEGNFKIKLQLAPGRNDVEVVARDEAENESRKNIVITYEI